MSAANKESPPKEKGAPREEGARSKLLTDILSVNRDIDETDPDSPLAQMRRRREAALRAEPLATGYRDPHFGSQRDGAVAI